VKGGLPVNANYTLDLIGAGQTVRWTPGKVLPAGFRLQLLERSVKDAGLAGGHTRDAWDESLATYGDKLKVVQTDQIVLRFPGNAEAVTMSRIRAYPESLGAMGAILRQMIRVAASCTKPR
jgi:hypothetical protein